MPALKLLFRRTLATTAVNPTAVLPSPPNHRRQSVQTMYGVTMNRRSTLASGGGGCARLGAHVKKTPNIKPQIISSTNNIRKQQKHPHPQKLYILSSSSSHSSSPFSSSSPKFEERENSIRVSSSTSSSSDSSPSSDKSPPFLVADMGHENNNHNNNQNGDVLSEKRNNSSHQQQQSSKLLTLPTVLTLARVAAIPVFIGTFYVESWWGTAATTSLFIAAAITDWLDGYLARKMGLGTAFGAFLDPVADKLMVAATLVLLCSRPPETGILGDMPWLFPVPAVAIIGREITMSAVREWAASQNTKLLQAVAVNNLGKWKTATQMTALTILLATRDSSLAGPGGLVTSGVALLYISAGLAVWSLVVYMRKIWKVLMR